MTASSDPNRTYIDEVMPAKLALDLKYIPRACVSYDIKLIWETLGPPWCGIKKGRKTE